MPLWIGRAYTKTFVFDGKYLVGANYVTNPEGTTTGSETVGGVTKRIPAVWWSHLIKLSQPLQASQLHRLLTDYRFVVQGSQDDEFGGFYVTLYDGGGNLLMPETQLPAMGDTPASYLYRRQRVYGVFTEAADVQIRFEWKDDATGSNPALTAAEIYNSTVEFQSTRQRANG
jgi:hypothetical protein